MEHKEYSSDDSYRIYHQISFDKQDHDPLKTNRGYGTIIIHKIIPSITYVGYPIDYRLLLRIMYIDKDIRRILKYYIEHMGVSDIKETISEIEVNDDIHEMWIGEMSSKTREVNPVNIKKRKLFTLLGNTILSLDPLTFYHRDLLMLFKVMDLKSRKEELRNILKTWRFKYDKPETDLFIFDCEDFKL